MSCGGHCGCPQCEGQVSHDDPAVQALSWGVLVARSQVGSSGFWGLAALADAYRRAERGPDSAVVDEWVARHYNALANGGEAGIDCRIAQESLGMDPPSEAMWYDKDESVVTAEVTKWAAVIGLKRKPKEKCCPESIHIRGVSLPRPKPCQPGWTVTWDATWSDDGECSCDCCEVRQFVSWSAGWRKGKLETDLSPTTLLEGEGTPYHPEHTTLRGLSTRRDPWKVYTYVDHDGSVQEYIQDHTFERIDPETGKPMGEESPAFMSEEALARLQDRIAQGTLRMSTPGVPGPAAGECAYRSTDRPECFRCAGGDEGACSLAIRVVIRPKPGCEGEPMFRVCQLSGHCRNYFGCKLTMTECDVT